MKIWHSIAPWTCLIVLGCNSAHAQHPPPITKIITVTLEITSVSPTTPIAGQAIVVNYQLHNAGLINKSFTGVVRGSFQNQALQTPGLQPAQTVTIAPHTDSQPATLIV